MGREKRIGPMSIQDQIKNGVYTGEKPTQTGYYDVHLFRVKIRTNLIETEPMRLLFIPQDCIDMVDRIRESWEASIIKSGGSILSVEELTSGSISVAFKNGTIKGRLSQPDRTALGKKLEDQLKEFIEFS